jgi:hypothetical protein
VSHLTFVTEAASCEPWMYLSKRFQAEGYLQYKGHYWDSMDNIGKVEIWFGINLSNYHNPGKTDEHLDQDSESDNMKAIKCKWFLRKGIINSVISWEDEEVSP